MTMSETVELDRESNPQEVRGYAFYDWAKSAFETSVTVAVLPAWYAYLFLKANGLTTTIGSIEMQGCGMVICCGNWDPIYCYY